MELINVSIIRRLAVHHTSCVRLGSNIDKVKLARGCICRVAELKEESKIRFLELQIRKCGVEELIEHVQSRLYLHAHTHTGTHARARASARAHTVKTRAASPSPTHTHMHTLSRHVQTDTDTDTHINQ